MGGWGSPGAPFKSRVGRSWPCPPACPMGLCGVGERLSTLRGEQDGAGVGGSSWGGGFWLGPLGPSSPRQGEGWRGVVVVAMLRCLGLSHMGALIFLPFYPPMERVPPLAGDTPGTWRVPDPVLPLTHPKGDVTPSGARGLGPAITGPGGHCLFPAPVTPAGHLRGGGAQLSTSTDTRAGGRGGRGEGLGGLCKAASCSGAEHRTPLCPQTGERVTGGSPHCGGPLHPSPERLAGGVRGCQPPSPPARGPD